MELLDIANKFKLLSKAVKCLPFNLGHINDTYVIECEEGEKYVLQRINSFVFKNVKELMDNIVGVTSYIKEKSLKIGKSLDECVEVILSIDNKPYLSFENNYYRVLTFISKGKSVITVPTCEEMYLAAKGFGDFQYLLDGYDANSLKDTIPNFHNTSVRFNNLLTAIVDNKANRKELVKDEIQFFFEREKYCSKIVNMLDRGELPYRVTHNDTKINNVLVDLINKRPIAVVDLDTVMKGAICYDFGDAIRSGCNTSKEDEKDLTKTDFNIDLFKAFSEGFLSSLKGTLSKAEIASLTFGAILMTYECGMRFLTDYINGDEYFKVEYDTHNLIRCRNQMKLLQSMESKFDEMEQIVNEIYYK